jgi:hypothetical protein
MGFPSVWGPQHWGKPVENSPDELAYLVKDSECVFPFAESYVAGDFGLDVYVWIWASSDDPQPDHHVARCRGIRFSVDDLGLKNPLIADNLAGNLAIDESFRQRIHGNGDIRIDEKHWPDFPVLIVVRQVCERGENRQFVLPTVITLERLRFIGGLAADVFEKSMVIPGLGSQVGENRELDHPRFIVGGFAPEMVDSELPPKVIEGTAQVVNGIADYQSPVIADFRHPFGDEEDPLCLRIELAARAENAGRRLSIACTDYGPPKRVYVGVRPVKLCPATSKATSGEAWR